MTFFVIAMGSHSFLVCAILSCYLLLRLQRCRGHAKRKQVSGRHSDIA